MLVPLRGLETMKEVLLLMMEKKKNRGVVKH